MTAAALLLHILQPLEDALGWLLEHLHQIGLPWGWAIVVTTILVRILLVPLTVRQIHSMQSLQKHAPEMKEIQKKYKGDKQKQNEELMKFYRENKINPMASCLPMIAQLPVFLSLYLVLKHSGRFIHAGDDISWLHIVPKITDKANSHWSGFLLLGIYALSQASSTYFMSTTMDKMQRRIMMVLPLFFITFIASFPIGLVLYWVTTNLWTVGQGLVTRTLVKKTPPPTPQKRSSRTPAQEAADAAAAAKTAAPGKATPPAPKPRPSGPAPTKRVKRKGRGGR